MLNEMMQQGQLPQGPMPPQGQPQGAMPQGQGIADAQQGLAAAKQETGDLPPAKAAAFQFAVNAQKTVQQMGPQNVVAQIGSGDPVQGVGQMAAMLMDAQVQSAMDAGKQLDTQMISAGMGRIVQDLAMLAQAGGALQIQSPEEGQSFAKQAFAMALKVYGDTALQREGMEEQGMQQGPQGMPQGDPMAQMQGGMPPDPMAQGPQQGMQQQDPGMLAGLMGGM